MIRLLTIIPSAIALLASAHAQSAEADDKTDTIYSYGRRERPAEEIGSAATIISSADIEARQYSFVADALKESPGVVVARNGAFGGFASARLRGASSGQTLVVIDGIVMNDPSAPQGGFNFANLGVADIEQIEVLRGPQSIIYGADAIGGVISIRTKRHGPEISGYAEGGSRGAARGGATWRGENGAGFARLTLSGATTDGISRAASGSESDGFRSIAASLAAGAAIGPTETLAVFGRASDSRSELDGFPAPFFSLADTEETESTRDYAISVRFTHGGFDRRDPSDTAGALTVSYSNVDRTNSDLDVETFAAIGDRLSADYAIASPLASFLSADAGAEIERTAVKVSGVDESALAGAAFVLLEATLSDRINFSAGARRDEFSNFQGATTARFAGVWRASRGARVRASWGEGFRAPTLFELNFEQFGVVPNSDLRPERATGYDFGVECDLGDMRVAATYFRQRVRDQIDFDFARNGFFNLNRVRSEGVEIEIDTEISDAASAHLSYTFIDAQDAATEAAIARTPKHSGAATLSIFPTDTLSLSASVYFNGRESDFPTPNQSFVRVDVRAAWSLADSLQVYARIENASDTDYQDVSGYAEPGASVFAGLRVKR